MFEHADQLVFFVADFAEVAMVVHSPAVLALEQLEQVLLDSVILVVVAGSVVALVDHGVFLNGHRATRLHF